MPTLQEVLPLIDLQKLDFMLIQLKKKLDKLPQREHILALSKRINELEIKQREVIKLLSQLGEEYERLRLDITHNHESLQETEDKIRAQAGDYRVVSALTSELEHLSELKGAYANKESELADKLSRARDLEIQIETLLEDYRAKYEASTESFRQEGSVIIDQITEVENKRSSLASLISQDILKAYEKSCLQHKGVGVAVLEQGSCSVCRQHLHVSHLSQVKSCAPLARCPHCTRLLIVS